MDRLLLSSAYLPPVEYFAALARYGQAWIEAHENYQKQSYRNRCTILTSNGKMNLNIPVKRGGDDFTHSIPISEIEIDYSENWPIRHLRALEAAYMNSPFFVYYKDEISEILLGGETSLFRFNLALTKLLVKFCGIKAELHLTEDFIPPAGKTCSESSAPDSQGGYADFRSRIHPKGKRPSLMQEWDMEKPYWQVFAQQGFVSNLSVVDLLFNEGPNAISFLK